MSHKTYLGLSSLSRSQTRILDQSRTELASYLFCIAPFLEEKLQHTLKAVLTQMHTEEKGSRILADMEIPAFESPHPAEVELLLRVYDTYAE